MYERAGFFPGRDLSLFLTLTCCDRGCAPVNGVVPIARVPLAERSVI